MSRPSILRRAAAILVSAAMLFLSAILTHADEVLDDPDHFLATLIGLQLNEAMTYQLCFIIIFSDLEAGGGSCHDAIRFQYVEDAGFNISILFIDDTLIGSDSVSEIDEDELDDNLGVVKFRAFSECILDSNCSRALPQHEKETAQNVISACEVSSFFFTVGNENIYMDGITFSPSEDVLIICRNALESYGVIMLLGRVTDPTSVFAIQYFEIQSGEK